MLWLYLIPTWLLGVLIVGSLIFVSVIGFLIVSPLVRRIDSTGGESVEREKAGNEIVYCFMGATGVIYALVLGLFAVATWDSLKGVEDVAMREALQAGKIYWDVYGYPEDIRAKLQPMIRKYLQTVISEEWPQQQKNIEATDPPVLQEMTMTLVRVQPRDEGQKLIHAEVLHQYNELLSYRRARREAVNTELPKPLWAVVLLGAALNIGLCYLVVTDRRTMHLILIGAVAAMVGVMIFVIAAVDHPLWGGVSVSADSYVEVLKSFGPDVTGANAAATEAPEHGHLAGIGR